MYNERYNCAFVLFADESVRGRNGNALKDFIINNSLGKVRESFKKNVRVFIWEVSPSKTQTWFYDNI